MSPIVVASGSKASDPKSAKPADKQNAAQARNAKNAAALKNAKWVKSGRSVPGAKKITNELLPGFSRQLSAMLSAGMPIVASLEALEEQTEHPSFKIIISEIRKSIENGSAFSDALRQFPSVFDDLYSNMVKGGETGGQLAETISRLAAFQEASARLRRKVKSAMMYPTIVLCIALIIATGMILFIVPVFAKMFEDFNAKLPTPTQFLLDTSAFLRHNWFYIAAVITGAVIGFKKWKATPSGAYNFDKILLRLPIVGELNRKVASSRFARTLGQLIRSGVPILSSLEIVSGATGNLVAGRIILQCRSAVEVGEPLSSAMVKQDIFPSMLVRMLQAGEKTGKIDEMMDSIADFYDEEVETMLAGLTSLMEPLLMVFLGVTIGGIVLCMFLPIFKMASIVTG